MGVKLEIAGIEYDVLDYSVTEEATPLSIDDTAQGTGTMSATLQLPEVYSEARKLQTEVEVNSFLNPILTLDQIVYDPDIYSVTEAEEGVRVERTGPTDGIGRDFFEILPPSGVPTSYPWFLVRGVVGFGGRRTSDIPGRYRSGGSYNLNSPVDYALIEIQTPSEHPQSLGYPFVGVPGLSISTQGDWIEIARWGSRRDTLTGNSLVDPTSTRRVTFRWLNGENSSPSIASWASQVPGSDLVSTLGAGLVQGAKYRLTDSRKGVTSGVVSDVSITEGGALNISGITDLDLLNSYNVQTFPSNLSSYTGFEGTLAEAVRYYAALSGVTYIWVDPEVADIPVSYPGWEGESWFHLKQLAGIHGCELSFVAGFPVFRPVRGRITEPGRWVSRTASLSNPRSAMTVEGYNLNVRDIRDEYVIHPDMGDGTVLSAERGEIAEFVVDIPASLYRITYVAANFTSEEGYNLTWANAGATVTLNTENPSQVIVQLSPPRSLKTERVYVGFLQNGTRVPRLYVRGDGVGIEQELVQYGTGAAESRTGTPVGATISSPFLSDSETTGAALKRVASNFSVPQFTLSGAVTNVNRRGDSGIPDFISYDEAQRYLEGALGVGFTYAELKSYSESLEQGNSYAALQTRFSLNNSQDYRFQEFGNVAGSRIWDEQTRRWYRVRSATITPFTIDNIQADDDLLFQEFWEPWETAGYTYGDITPGNLIPVGGPDQDSNWLNEVQAISYGQLQLMGVPNVQS